MSWTTFTISGTNYNEAVEWMEERLAELKVPKREILTAELLMEEDFIRLAEASGDAKSLNALMMVAAPMIFFSVAAGITGMSDAADIGRMGGKLLLISIAKLAGALALAIWLGIWMGAMPELMAMAKEGASAGEKD